MRPLILPGSWSLTALCKGAFFIFIALESLNYAEVVAEKQRGRKGKMSRLSSVGWKERSRHAPAATGEETFL